MSLSFEEVEEMLKDIPTSQIEGVLLNRRGTKRKSRYAITGMWQGHNSSKHSVQHREYTINKNRVDSIIKLDHITFSDGTRLVFQVREMEYRERKDTEITWYKNTINSCIMRGTSTVQ